MTDETERKWLDEAARLAGYTNWDCISIGIATRDSIRARARTLREKAALEAVCKALEEAFDEQRDRHDAFRREVSEAITEYCGATYFVPPHLFRFILPPPDPLAEACKEAHAKGYHDSETAFADDLRAALAKRGLKIVEGASDA